MLGRVIKREKLMLSTVGQTVTINLNNIASGSYVLSLVRNGKRVQSVIFEFYSY
jgi:hypothetical protein